jgi:hypothetical protein
MLPLLRFEEARYPGLKSVFLDSPDRAVEAIPSAPLWRRSPDLCVSVTLSCFIKTRNSNKTAFSI